MGEVIGIDGKPLYRPPAEPSEPVRPKLNQETAKIVLQFVEDFLEGHIDGFAIAASFKDDKSGVYRAGSVGWATVGILARLQQHIIHDLDTAQVLAPWPPTRPSGT